MSKKCMKCGAELEDNAFFCDECGAQQATPETTASVEGHVSQTNAKIPSTSQYHQLCWWFAITPPGSFVFPPKGGLTNRSFLLLVTA